MTPRESNKGESFRPSTPEAAEMSFIKLVLTDSEDINNYLFNTSVIKKDKIGEKISGKL